MIHLFLIVDITVLVLLQVYHIIFHPSKFPTAQSLQLSLQAMFWGKELSRFKFFYKVDLLTWLRFKLWVRLRQFSTTTIFTQNLFHLGSFWVKKVKYFMTFYTGIIVPNKVIHPKYCKYFKAAVQHITLVRWKMGWFLACTSSKT